MERNFARKREGDDLDRFADLVSLVALVRLVELVGLVELGGRNYGKTEGRIGGTTEGRNYGEGETG